MVFRDNKFYKKNTKRFKYNYFQFNQHKVCELIKYSSKPIFLGKFLEYYLQVVSFCHLIKFLYI